MIDNEVHVRLSELRTAAENLNAAADKIDAAVTTTNDLVETLMARGFVSPAASAFHTRFLGKVTWMDEWPVHVREFAIRLTEAADEIEAAVGSTIDTDVPPDTGHGDSAPPHDSGGFPLPAPAGTGTGTGTGHPTTQSGYSGTSSGTGTSGSNTTSTRRRNQQTETEIEEEEPAAPPEPPPLEAYISAANRPLYDQIATTQQQIVTEEENLNLLRTRRQALQDQYDDLLSRLEAIGGNTSNARLEALLAEIESLDGEIAASEARITELQTSIADMQMRLERVRPGAGADLELIASLEGSRTIDAILNATRQEDNSLNCVNWVSTRMPIPPGIPGNAMTWIDNAMANPEYGITVGDVPLTGSVIVMQPEHSYANDVFGHVMYVERVENGQVWVTDNFNNQPVLLTDLTDELAGPYIKYMYFPWQTQA